MTEKTKTLIKVTRLLFRAPLCVALLLLCVSAQAQSIKLERGWQFLPDREATFKLTELTKAQGWRDVQVGLSWNAQFADLRDYMGAAWYRTAFDAPNLSDGRRALLHFGAVDYFSEVFVNGKQVGTHEGGYTPFTFDITDALRTGANELVVRVVDPPMDEAQNRARFPEMLYNEIPHGKQNWYVQTGGIWQPGWIEIKPKDHIASVKVVAKVDGSVIVMVSSNAHLGPPPPAPPRGGSTSSAVHTQTILDRITVRVIDQAGNKSYPLKLTGGGGFAENDYVYFAGQIPKARLWSTEQPNLYTVETKLGDDSVSEQFGFRSFEARDGKFYLNGQPFYMIAALDQDFYPETIYTPPSKQYVRDQMLKAKRLGLNLLRCHIKVCDPTYLEAADEVGMLVWYEIPSWNDGHHFAAIAAERGEKIFNAMVERDWNHPSIVIQSIINEGWGLDLPHQAESRRWLRAAFDRAKRLTAPLGRLIVDNSACCDNFHLRTDITDNHRYNSIPDEYQPFDQWIADFAARPAWNFSPHGDAEPTGREPLVVSEFGNWGLPKLPRELPWWFERDFGGNQVTRPAGLFDRFKEYQFNSLFKDYDALAEATQWHQFISLKHEIEEIRRHASIQGYVITEFTDINWEANGLMSMWREPKAYAAELAKIQQADVVLARLPKYNFTAGERARIDTLLSHYREYAAGDSKAVRLRWSTSWGSHGDLGETLTVGPESGSGNVESLQTLELIMPSVISPQKAQLSLQVISSTGRLLAENAYDLFVYPKAEPKRDRSLYFHDPDRAAAHDPAKRQSALAEALTAAGVHLTNDSSEPAATELLVSTALDQTVTQHLRAGGRALIIAGSTDALPADASLKVTPRAGSDLDGNWVTNFNWVRTAASSPFGAVAFGPILGFESERVVPRFVIQGVAPASYDDVLSGIFYGWLNNNAALAMQMRMGQGKLLLTTFRFDDYGRDPYATRLLDAMIAYTRSAAFSPKLEYQTK